MRRQREGRLVRVDVLLAAGLAAVVAWQAVVPLVVFEGPDAEEGRDAEEEAGRGAVGLARGALRSEEGVATYKTKKPRPTMALLAPHAEPHRSAVL